MWSLELNSLPEISHSAARRRAHNLRAAALARLARAVAAIFRRRPHRPSLPKVAPVQTDGVLDARAGVVAATSSAADTDEEPPRLTASTRSALRADAEPPVLLERAGTVATLTLNRPERLNAISYEMVDRLQFLLDEVEQDDTIRSVLLTGAGTRAFSAGADIHEFSRSVDAGRAFAVRDFVSRGQALTARIERFPKPIIAAINGLAFGGGCEILEAAHLAVAADTATFAKPEIRLDMPPTFGGTQRLPRIAGRKRALEHLLTGEPFDAEHALSLGLVNSVVPASELMNAAHRLAHRTTMHSRRAVAAILEAVSRGADRPIGEALLEERAAFAGLVGTPELRDGLASWRDRPRVRS